MDFKKMAEYRNTRSPFAQRMGIVVDEVSLGYARIVKNVTDEDLNPQGHAHGGLFFSMADNACGMAVASHGYKCVTVSGSYNFFRGANSGDTLVAEGREVKHGKTLCVSEVTIKNQDGVLMGNGTYTFYCLDEPIEG